MGWIFKNSIGQVFLINIIIEIFLKELRRHPRFIVYKSSTELSFNLAQNVFEECAGWSVLYGLRWVLVIRPFALSSGFFLEDLCEKNAHVGFIYYHKAEKQPYILLGLESKNLNLDLAESLGGGVILDWVDIFKIMLSGDYINHDFNHDFLFWHLPYQQCIGAFLDCMAMGSVFDLPKTWQPLELKSNLKKKENATLARFEKNYEKYRLWYEKNKNSLNEQELKSAFPLKFIIWYESNF